MVLCTVLNSKLHLNRDGLAVDRAKGPLALRKGGLDHLVFGLALTRTCMREVSTCGFDARLDGVIGLPKVVGLFVRLDVEHLDLYLHMTLRLGPHA